MKMEYCCKFLYNNQMPNSIGEILKNQRLDRKFSLDDAAAGTHIRYKYLEALENNDFDLLPSAVQGRGFLRSYAEFLGLDSDLLLKSWETRTVIPEPTEQPPATPDKSSADKIDELEQIPSFPLQSETTQDKPQNAVLFQPPQPSPKPVETSKSEILFTKVGSTLRNQREILGLSLNDIEQYTHIRQFYLQAIEDGKFHELPSPVQAKGMIENYAQFLDINSDELLLDYAEGLQTQREEKLALNNPQTGGFKIAPKAVKQTLAHKLLTPDLLIGAAVIFFLVVFAIWTTSRVISSRNLSAEATIPGISEVLVSTVSPTPELVSAIPSQMGTVMETPAPQTGISPVAETEIPTEPALGTETNGLTPTILFEDNAPLQLNIVITQRTYLKIIADGKTVFDGRPQPGNAYPFSANETIELISGNAAALQILFNEVSLGTIGNFGEVVDLIFTGGQVVTPTPKFTATVTRTQAPTMTLQPTATLATPSVTSYIP